MKHSLLAAVLFVPATGWAQYTPFQTKLYLQITGLVNGYPQLADTANQQVAVQWPQEQIARVVGSVGNIGHKWFAITAVTPGATKVFYVKGLALHGKAQLVDDPADRRYCVKKQESAQVFFTFRHP